MVENKEILIRLIKGKEIIFQHKEEYDDMADAEEAVEAFIERVDWTFGYEYDLNWDWTRPDQIDIWVN